ncbi:DUF6438 domain-containing protein [Rurimicrobium arvi]|uniref:DUF6438 domain-containing protein n=1 Tax=Rurimicrobium arvi TaxID=2049916 RepID=A0ABP8MUE2_9BACT
MPRHTFKVLLFLSIIFSFAGVQAMHKGKKKQKTASAAVTNKSGLKSVLMGRSACFGTCPVYSVEVFENGMVRYIGKSHVERVGTYEKMGSKNDAVNLFNDFAVIRPDTLHRIYKQKIADLPGFYFFISYADSVHKVLNADAGPEFLRDWAKRFDTFGNVDDSWKKVE